MAYQDHQMGTVFIQEFVSDWVWGHFSNDQVAVVFFQILTQQGQMIERIAMITKDGCFTGTAIRTNYLDTLFPAEDLAIFTNHFSVSFLDGQYRFEFDISPTKLIRYRLGEFHDSSNVSYLRWAAGAELQGGCSPQPLRGISEYIRIRPAMYGELSNR